ncbi:DUF2059 domain-containing protein [Pseudooceanicola nanhaiensis]|uniref:DUF2059 domain-containing protein n=1 Tax=Pseudooceanicola nanhaiensis TaxID=375761 RepID=UPI001CD6860B|nr:DUF2059 domain-containing protein [Pseudooceanicola nanhaiensis]MCA0921650.1 DUF2059 domain-containing protein [Pseudooceanicola nanhaiensis]
MRPNPLSFRSFRPLALLQICLLAVPLLAAHPVRAADEARVKDFLKVTGFDVSLESIKQSAEQAPRMLGVEADDFGASWQVLVDEVFDVPLMQQMGTEILVAALDDEALDYAEAFYGSDLGKRLVEAENDSHLRESDDKYSEGQALVEGYGETDPERIEIIRRMMEAIGSVDTSVRALQTVELRFILAAQAAGVITLRIDEEQLRDVQRKNAPEIAKSIESSSLAASAATYKDFTDGELDTYAEALEHPLMQRVYELMNAVQFEIMANRFEALAKEMRGLAPAQDL